MNIDNNELFLNIDGVGELINEYCESLEKEENICGHIILVSGDTGCGKNFFSRECIRKVLEKKKDVVVIDMLDHFKASNYDSERKLYEVLEIIEYELIAYGAFDELKGKSTKPAMFKRILEKMLKDKKIILLIRFPQIEVFEEIEKFYSFLYNDNTISYFITDSKTIVDECKKKIEGNIKYFECMHLKEGDGKLVVEKIFSGEEYPKFDVNELELLMSNRPLNNRMTIKELKRICDYSYTYAKENGINNITNGVIALAMAANSQL